MDGTQATVTSPMRVAATPQLPSSVLSRALQKLRHVGVAERGPVGLVGSTPGPASAQRQGHHQRLHGRCRQPLGVIAQAVGISQGIVVANDGRSCARRASSSRRGSAGIHGAVAKRKRM